MCSCRGLIIVYAFPGFLVSDQRGREPTVASSRRDSLSLPTVQQFTTSAAKEQCLYIQTMQYISPRQTATHAI